MERIQEKIKEAIFEAQKETRVTIDQSISSLKETVLGKIDQSHSELRVDLNQKFELISKMIQDDEANTKSAFEVNHELMQHHEQNLKDFIFQNKISRRKDRDDITSYIYKVDSMTKDNLNNINSIFI